MMGTIALEQNNVSRIQESSAKVAIQSIKTLTFDFFTFYSSNKRKYG